MANLYDIAQSFDTLWLLLNDDTVADEVLIDAFDNLTDDLKSKLEGCCKFIKNEEATIAGLKEEEKRLKERRQAAENRISRLKDLMKLSIKMSGEKKLACGTFTVSVQANPESVVMDEQYIENIPEEYLKYKDPEIDRTKIKEELKNGAQLWFAHLEQTEGVRIR